MKKLCLVVALLLTCTFAFAQTIVSADINASTWWTSAGSPYIVINDIDVNAVLYVTPGTEIISVPSTSINFTPGSQLRCEGNALNRVVWTGVNNYTWEGLNFNNSLAIVIYTDIQNTVGDGAVNIVAGTGFYFDHCGFYNNTYRNLPGDDIGGGAISAVDVANLDIHHSKFDGNYFIDTISESGDIGGGSAIAALNIGNLRITRNSFLNNKCDWAGTVFAQSIGDRITTYDILENSFEKCAVGLGNRGEHNGGAIALYVQYARDRAFFNINGNEISKCTATACGGAIYANTNDCLCTEIDIKENIMKENKADKYGGGLCVYESDYSDVIDWDIHDNYAGSNGFLDNENLYGGGYAIVNDNNAHYLNSNIDFKGNTAEYNAACNGGGIYVYDQAIISECTFNNNKVTNNGGGAYFSQVWWEATGDYLMHSTLFEANYAERAGAGVYAYNSTPVEHRYKYVDFFENEVNSTTPGPAFYSECTGGGGADKLEVFFGSCRFYDNTYDGDRYQVAKHLRELDDFPFTYTAKAFTFYHCGLQYNESDLAVYDLDNDYDADPFNILPIWGIIDNSRSLETEETAVIEAPVAVAISNYPNPFNPTTCVSLDMPAAGHVSVNIYNTRGQKVTTLFDGEATVGTNSWTWDGKDDSGNDVSSGVYFTRVVGGEKTLTHKMMLLK